MLMLTQRMNGRALECIICLRFLLNLFVENWKYHKVSYLIESNRKFMRKLMISDAPSHQLLLAFLYPGLESNEYIHTEYRPFGPFYFIRLNSMPKGKQIRQQQQQE